MQKLKLSIAFGTVFINRSFLRPPLIKFMSSGGVDPNESNPDFHSKIKRTNFNFEEISFAKDLTKEEILKKIDENVKSKKIVLMMKGDPDLPACGYSKMVIEILKFYKVDDFLYINVLASNEVRNTAKEYAEWPTYPQLYLNGELVGGCDILMEMHKDGSLEKLIKN